MKYYKYLIFAALFAVIIPHSYSFGSIYFDNESEETVGLFASEETLNIILKTDLKALIKNKYDNEYQEGELTVAGESYPIRLKARGNNRREICSFPPVTLNFSKTEFKDKSFDQLKKLKLVNSCKMQKSYEQYILREYLIYKALNIMTDKSFKVRLLKIDYEDSKEKIKTVTRYGFVIEDQYMMADRLDGIIYKKTGVRDQSTNKEQMVMLSIFHFMVGNTDWQVARLHNLKLLKLKDVKEAAPYVIAYDFDHTGMVDAAYSVPSPILGIESLRERLYWGKCYTDDELIKAINRFIQNKEAIYSLYQNFELFDKSSLNSSISYLDSFYKIIEDDKKWRHYFVQNCRQ